MQFTTANGPLEVEIDQLIIAGWTGRDHAAVSYTHLTLPTTPYV